MTGPFGAKHITLDVTKINGEKDFVAYSVSISEGKYINVALLNHTVVVLFEDSSTISAGNCETCEIHREILNDLWAFPREDSRKISYTWVIVVIFHDFPLPSWITMG